MESDATRDFDGSTEAIPETSVVIRAFNEEKHIGRLLTGIMRQSLKDIEIILVDSGSTDSTVSIANQYPVKVVNISPEEFTFGRSLNKGIAIARGRFIVIASAHVYPVYPDWLEELLSPFEDPQVAVTYGKQRGNSTTRYSEQQFFRQWFPDETNLRQVHPFCNNANAAIRREFWERHPYDETLSGLEDLAWAKWAMEQGYVISYVPEAEVIHLHEETPRQVLNRFRREAMAFKHLFPQESFRFHTFLRLYLTNVFNDMWQALQERILWKNLGSILMFRLMQFWGTYLGYRHAGPLTEQLRWVFYYPPGSSTKQQNQDRSVQPIDYLNADR
jgi:glycosyltransferase involved in cell wall biosynthesis